MIRRYLWVIPLFLAVVFLAVLNSSVSSARADMVVALQDDSSRGDKTAAKSTDHHKPHQIDEKSVSPPDLQRIQERGNLIVAVVDFNLPPFVVRDSSGQLSGVDVDLARRIAIGLKVNVVFVTASTFNGVVDMVATGAADIGVSKLSITLERAKKVRFSTPYLVLRHALLLNSLRLTKEGDGDAVKMVKHFDKQLAVVRGSAYVEFAHTSFPNASVQEYETWDPDILTAVQNGTVFATLRDEYEVMKVMRTYPSASLLLKPVILTDMFSNIAVAVSWRDTQLLSWIDLYISMSPVKLTTKTLLNALEPSSSNTATPTH